MIALSTASEQRDGYSLASVAAAAGRELGLCGGWMDV